MGILELELDDWLDPSMPRMYTDVEFGPSPHTLSDEFTASNHDFESTCVFPPFTPLNVGLNLKIKPASRLASNLYPYKKDPRVTTGHTPGYLSPL